MPAHSPKPTSAGSAHWPRTLLLAAVLVCVAGVAYAPVGWAGFIWDDDSFLTANALIKASDGLHRFWATTQAPDYWPVTSSSLWLEWRLWGMHAAGYHWTNLGLHVGECLLLWAVLRQLRFPGAYLAALLFAVHPVNVESVAWIAQRKNLMAMLFYLASIHWFLKIGGPSPAATVRRSLHGGGSIGVRRTTSGELWYALSLGAFILAMLSKGSVATLPAVLALLLWWQGRWSGKACLRLIPFALISLFFASVDVWFQHLGATEPIRSAGFMERLLGAPAAVEFYLAKALWPYPLNFVYAEWHIRPTNLLWWLPLLSAIGLTALLWHYRKRWSRPLLFAWAYFCLTLGPVLGFTDVYFMKYSLVADHYQHLALIGVVALAAAAWAGWQRRQGGVGPSIAASLVVALLATLTFLQCLPYRDKETLYRSTLEKNPTAWLVHNNLGILLLQRNETASAMVHFREALRLRPNYAEAHIDLGNALLRLSEPAAAAQEFSAALALKSDFDREAHLDLGHAWYELGKTSDAMAEYEAALRIDPRFAQAHYSIGNLYYSLSRFPEAIAEYRASLQIAPYDADALNNLGSALMQAGRPGEAVSAYERAHQLRPDDAPTSMNLLKAQAAAAPK
jgi:protein O-mannosyl-transferase